MRLNALVRAVTLAAAVSGEPVDTNTLLPTLVVLVFTDVMTDSFNIHWEPTSGAEGYVVSVWERYDFLCEDELFYENVGNVTLVCLLQSFSDYLRKSGIHKKHLISLVSRVRIWDNQSVKSF